MTPDQVFMNVAALVGGAAGICAALYAVYRIARRIDDALGLKDGKTLAERLDRVEHQLWENGGSSLADRVNRIEQTSIETSTEIKIIKEFIISGSIPVVEETTTKPRATTRKRNKAA